MLTSKLLPRALSGALGAVVALVAIASILSFSQFARADAIVFITRLGQVQTTYPRNNAFSVGTTSPTVAKLSVYANTGETNKRLFEVASSTAAGATVNLFKVDNTGCIQTFATSTATPVKLTFTATTTQGATNNFSVDAAYGSCL